MVYKHVLRRYAKQRFARVLFIFGKEDVNRIKAKYFQDGITEAELDAVEWKFWKSLIRKGELHRYIPYENRNACADQFDKIYDELKRLGESDAYLGIPLWKKGADALHKRQINLLRKVSLRTQRVYPCTVKGPLQASRKNKLRTTVRAAQGPTRHHTVTRWPKPLLLEPRVLCLLIGNCFT